MISMPTPPTIAAVATNGNWTPVRTASIGCTTSAVEIPIRYCFWRLSYVGWTVVW